MRYTEEFFLAADSRHSVDLEMSVLATILIDKRILAAILAMEVSENSFYLERHKLIFRAMRNLFDRGEALDYTTLQAELTLDGVLDQIGGVAYLASLDLGLADVESYQTLARQLISLQALRDLGKLGQRLVKAVQGPEADPSLLLSKLYAYHEQVAGLLLAGRLDGRDIPAIVADLLEEAENDEKELVAELPTPWPSCNDVYGGLPCGGLVIVAARPNIGKTTFALYLANHLAAMGKKVLFYSLEMSGRELGLTIIAQQSGVVRNTFQREKSALSKGDWQALWDAQMALKDWSFKVETPTALKPSQVAAGVARENPDIVMLDYLQLMESDINRPGTHESLNDIGRRMKKIAREHEIPVVCLSQLSRPPKNLKKLPGAYRPQLSDLRGSGGLEEHADAVWGLSRDPEGTNPCETEVIVLKSRRSVTGSFWLGMDPHRGRFHEPTRKWSRTSDDERDRRY